MRSVALFCLVSLVSCGNVLIFNPTYGNSHVKFMGTIAEILAKDGHNVTVFSPIVRENVLVFGTQEERIHKVKTTVATKVAGISILSDAFWTQPFGNRALPKSDIQGLNQLCRSMITGILEDEILLSSLKATKFDLVISEFFDTQPLVLFEALGIKNTIVASSLGMTDTIYEITGLPKFPSYVTDLNLNYGEKKSFWERLDSFLHHVENEWDIQSRASEATTYYKKYLPDLPPLFDLLKKRVSLVFSNANEFNETPRPQSNMVKYIGGMHITAPKSLSKKFEELLKLRSSTVLVSLGTFAKTCTMPDFMKQEFIQAFQAFPATTFLWKYEKCVNDSTTDFPPNVVTLEWMPQSDLLD